MKAARVATTGHDEATSARTDRGSHQRLDVALALALFGLVCAVVAATGPADRLHATYVWPAPNVDVRRDARLWYTPLLLARYEPERIVVDIPCRPRAETPKPVSLLASARDPARGPGLQITREGDRAVVRVGTEPITSIPVRIGAGRCARLTLEPGSWKVASAGSEREGRLAAMPRVWGLFTEVRPSSRGAPHVAVTPAGPRVRPIPRQWVAWALAVLAVIGSLVILARRTPRVRGSLSLRALVARRHPADAVVGGVLVVWWFLSPAFFDDGWVIAREGNFAASSGFSNYFDTRGIDLPNDYWLEWLQHWVVEASHLLLVLRVPALVLLLATWLSARYVLARSVGDDRDEHAALWPMAAAFLGFACAWGMTVRPEPATAFLAVLVLACAVSVHEGSRRSLPLIAVLIPFALTGHHAGVVALGPLLVVSPEILRSARAQARDAIALAICSLTLLVVLFAVGSDARGRLSDVAGTVRFSSGTDAWYREDVRYERLGLFIYATPLRRMTVVVMLLTVLSFALRRRWSRERLDVPTLALAAGLVLLVFTPSKHPWHFGALIGIATAAAGCETVRMRRTAYDVSRGSALRALVILVVAFLGIGWAWRMRNVWNVLDLRTLDWQPALEETVPLGLLAALVPLVTLLVLVRMARRRGRSPSPAPSLALAWLAPLALIPALAFTVTVLVTDAARTPGWTLTRQNFSSMTGGAGCGLADDLRVVLPGGRKAITLAHLMGSTSKTTLVMPDLLTYFPCTRLPRVADGVAEAPAYIVEPYAREILVQFDTSPFQGLRDLYTARPLRLIDDAPRRGDLDVKRFEPIPGAVVVPAVKRTDVS